MVAPGGQRAVGGHVQCGASGACEERGAAPGDEARAPLAALNREIFVSEHKLEHVGGRLLVLDLAVPLGEPRDEVGFAVLLLRPDIESAETGGQQHGAHQPEGERQQVERRWEWLDELGVQHVARLLEREV